MMALINAVLLNVNCSLMKSVLSICNYFMCH